MERRRRLLGGVAIGGACVVVGFCGIVRAVEALRETAARGGGVTPEGIDRTMDRFLVFGFGGGLLLAVGLVLAGLCLAARARMRREEREEIDGPA